MKLSLNGIVALLATTAAAFPLIEDDADMIKSFPLSRRQVDKVPRAAIFHAFNDTDCKSFEMEARFEAHRPELKNRITCVNLGGAQVASLKALFLKTAVLVRSLLILPLCCYCFCQTVGCENHYSG